MSADGDYSRGKSTHPPQSTETEQNILGGLMLDNRKWYAVSGLVSEDDFYHPDHRTIWRGIATMLGDGRPVDFSTLSEHLRDQGQLEEVGGFSFIGTLAADCLSTSNIEAYAKRVRELSHRRSLIDLGRRTAQDALDGGESEAVAAQCAAGLERILSSRAGTSKRFAEGVEEAEATITANKAKRVAGGIIGAPSGLPALDRITGGFVGERLIVIGARPGTGKTALLNQFAIHSARNGFPGLICSLEMGCDELVIRALATEAKANVTLIMRGHDIEAQAAYDAASRIGDVPLWIDTATSTIEGICAQVAVHKARHGITWAAIDHIGLVGTEQKFGSRNDKLGHISWTLKSLAKRLKMPVIALSQLSRKGENEDRMPREDDLRDSGNVEQDADMIILLHTPPGRREDLCKPVEIGVVKNRAGPKAWINGCFEFDGPTQTFRQGRSCK